jgi:hypothetical protein
VNLLTLAEEAECASVQACKCTMIRYGKFSANMNCRQGAYVESCRNDQRQNRRATKVCCGSRAFDSTSMSARPLPPNEPTLKALMCSSESGRYCCKSPKWFGTDFFVRKQQSPRSPIHWSPDTFPKSPMSLSPGNEVPHIFTQKSRQQPRKILISSGKRLLQQNRPRADY